jgi:hypothetical protein
MLVGMDTSRRLYDAILSEHLAQHRQMAFLTGPRQVGKTFTCRRQTSDQLYLNWDNPDHRRIILKGPTAIAETACPDLPDPHAVIRQPTRIPDADFQALWEHGGFPAPEWPAA